VSQRLYCFLWSNSAFLFLQELLVHNQLSLITKTPLRGLGDSQACASRWAWHGDGSMGCRGRAGQRGWATGPQNLSYLFSLPPTTYLEFKLKQDFYELKECTTKPLSRQKYLRAPARCINRTPLRFFILLRLTPI
jgi:hypothetical protein